MSVKHFVLANGQTVKYDLASLAGARVTAETISGFFESGAWTVSGDFADNSKRARSKVIPPTITNITCVSGYTFATSVWTGGTYIGYLHTNGTVSTSTSNILWGTSLDVSDLRGKYPASDIRILVKNSENTDIDPFSLDDVFTFDVVDVSNVKTEINDLDNKLSTEIDTATSAWEWYELANILEQGGLSWNTELESNTRVRTAKHSLAFGTPDGCYVTFKEGFKYAIYYFNQAGQAVARSHINGDQWLTMYGTFPLTEIMSYNYSGDNHDISEATNLTVIIGYPNDAVITVEDAVGAFTIKKTFPHLNKIFTQSQRDTTTTYSATVREGVPVYGLLKVDGSASYVNMQVVFSLSGTHFTSEFNPQNTTMTSGVYPFVLLPHDGGDCNLVWYKTGITGTGTTELWLSDSAGVDLAPNVRTDDEVVVAPYNYKLRYTKNIDFFCDGVNDEVEIQQAIDIVSSWEHGTVKLLNGTFNIDSFTEYDPAVAPRPTALLVKSGAVSINIEGTSSERGAVLNVTATALAQQEELDTQCDVFGISVRPIDSLVINYKNMRVNVADQNHPVIVFDNYYCGCSKMESIRMYCNGYGAGKMPVEGLIGVRCTRGSNNGIGNEMTHIGATGFYEAFQLGGEHLVAYDLLGRNNYYAYTFGNYDYDAGLLEHPYTLINCADEMSACLPLFGRNGKYNTQVNDGMQQIDLIGFNLEIRKDTNPTLADPLPAVELQPNTFCGRIEFTATKNFDPVGNMKAFNFWADGSGENFRTVNMTHKQGGTTAERLTYTPTYMQEYYDTTLHKKLIYDGTNWVDCNGQTV